MKITISDIPGFFPNGYSEQLYISANVYRDGVDSTIFKTPIKHKILNDETYRERIIQSIIYDKYRLELITTESVNLDLLTIGNEIIFDLDNGETHKPEFLEIPEGIKLGNTEFRKYNLIYRNLYSKSTINNLLYDSINNPDYYMSLKYNGGTLYTKIFPDFDFLDYEITENNENYLKMVSSESGFNVITAYFYLNQQNIPNYKKEINYNNLALTYLQIGTVKYEPLEVPIIEIDGDELEGVRLFKITIRYDQTLNYPYV